MKDSGLNKGLVQNFNTSDRRSQGIFYGFRKMFWTYLKKLNVAFSDPCCDDAAGMQYVPVRMDIETGELQYFNPYDQEWVNVDDWSDPTTTTTSTSSSTTTTTTTP